MAPQIKKIQARPDHTILVNFKNGDVRVFDAKPYLKRGIFTELQDPAYFKKARIIRGGIEWPHNQDLSADTLYYKGFCKFGNSKASRSIQKGLVEARLGKTTKAREDYSKHVG